MSSKGRFLRKRLKSGSDKRVSRRDLRSPFARLTDSTGLFTLGILKFFGRLFLAIALVLVYVGAVMVLFLFVVMMLDVNVDSIQQGFWKHFPLAAGIGALIALEMATVLMGGFRMSEEPKTLLVIGKSVTQISNTKELGVLLYTTYLYPLQIAAIILLVAVISAIALTLRERKDSKYISVSDQVRVKARDRMDIIKMDATKKAVAPAQQLSATVDIAEKKA